jgi:hypothetical protein
VIKSYLSVFECFIEHWALGWAGGEKLRAGIMETGYIRSIVWWKRFVSDIDIWIFPLSMKLTLLQ